MFVLEGVGVEGGGGGGGGGGFGFFGSCFDQTPQRFGAVRLPVLALDVFDNVLPCQRFQGIEQFATAMFHAQCFEIGRLGTDPQLFFFSPSFFNGVEGQSMNRVELGQGGGAKVLHRKKDFRGGAWHLLLSCPV